MFTPMNDEAYYKVLEHVRQVDIANYFNISNSAVWQWRKRIPPERIPGLVKLCKGKVTGKEMNPDMYRK